SGQPTLAIHKEFGHLIFLMVFALLILAFVGRLPSPMQLATAVLSVITAFQTEVFALLPGSPLRAFHTVLPLVIFFLAAFLARSATSLVRVRLEQATFPLPTGESRATCVRSIREARGLMPALGPTRARCRWDPSRSRRRTSGVPRLAWPSSPRL